MKKVVKVDFSVAENGSIIANFPALDVEGTGESRSEAMTNAAKAFLARLSAQITEEYLRDRMRDLVDSEIAVEACARAAHETNRAYCLALGDTSQPSWDDAPDWQRDSAVLGVKGVFKGNEPEQSHECWLEEKRRTGWTWGPKKDSELKQHPCMVPYDELPEEQRLKDTVFVSTVRLMSLSLGMALEAREIEKLSTEEEAGGEADGA